MPALITDEFNPILWSGPWMATLLLQEKVHFGLLLTYNSSDKLPLLVKKSPAIPNFPPSKQIGIVV